jgi:hypothetical protein
MPKRKPRKKKAIKRKKNLMNFILIEDHKSKNVVCAVPGHLEKTFLSEAMAMGEVVGSIWLLLEEDEAVEVFSSEAVVRCSSAGFLGQAKRLSGRMGSKLLKTQKETK